MKRALLDRLLEYRRAKCPAALVVDLASGRQTLVTDHAVFGDLPLSEHQLDLACRAALDDRSGPLAPDEALFVKAFAPPLRMIVVGAVHIAQVLVPMASLAGYAVTVIDPRRAWATSERFPNVTLTTDWPDEALAKLKPDRRTAIVTLTHDPKLDDPALTAALRSDVFYIGALGSRRTHARRLERLRDQGFGAGELERIHGPVGLALGATSPAEIAVSILAQVIQVLHQPTAARTAVP